MKTNMKFSHLILLACVSVCMTFVSCKDSTDESKSDTPESVSPNANPDGSPGIMDPTMQPVSPGGQQAINNPNAAVGGESHYKCQTVGCTGGSASQGSCPVCGAELVHNQAFHAANQGEQAPPSASQTTPVMIDPATGKPATPEQIAPPSAKNSAGEYHYACPAGHAGAGAAGNCSTCGAALTHNTAYHNK